MGRRKKIVENNIKTEEKVMDAPEFKVIAETEPPEHPELPDFQEKDLFNIDEAADYMSVSAETIRLWIDHGHLAVQLIGGIRKIPLESMVRCRIKIRRF